MHWQKIEENWESFKGMAKEKWQKLSDSDLDQIGGKRDRLIQKLQDAYGVTREQAEIELKEFSYDPRH